MTLLGGEVPPRALAPAWFLPLLIIFAAIYMITAFMGIIRSLPGEITDLNSYSPQSTWSGLFSWPSMSYPPWAVAMIFLGAVGVFTGVGHLAAAYWLSSRDPQGARGANAFLFAGAVLLALACPWPRTASCVAPAPGGGCSRGSSDVGKVAQRKRPVDVVPPADVCGRGAASSRPRNCAICLVTCAVSRWDCLHGFCPVPVVPQPEAARRIGLFFRIDKNDLSAVTILLASLTSAFFMLQGDCPPGPGDDSRSA